MTHVCSSTLLSMLRSRVVLATWRRKKSKSDRAAPEEEHKKSRSDRAAAEEEHNKSKSDRAAAAESHTERAKTRLASLAPMHCSNRLREREVRAEQPEATEARDRGGSMSTKSKATRLCA